MKQPPGLQTDLLRCSAETRQWVLELSTTFGRLWDFASSQPCECYDEYGKRKPQPCERCQLVYGHDTWNEFGEAATAVEAAMEAEKARRDHA